MALGPDHPFEVEKSTFPNFTKRFMRQFGYNEIATAALKNASRPSKRTQRGPCCARKEGLFSRFWLTEPSGTDLFNFRRRVREGGKSTPLNRLRPLSELEKTAKPQICTFSGKTHFEGTCPETAKMPFSAGRLRAFAATSRAQILPVCKDPRVV